MTRTAGGVVSAVSPDGIGAEVGIEPGDVLASINGHPLRDVIDYQFYGADERLELVVERAGEEHRVQIERDADEDLGLDFATPLFDGLRECTNHCPFCFVRQMPRRTAAGALRRSLALRDDDYRLSFLSGSFVTLTNLSEDDWQRIAEQHLSPLYVSVHATDSALRHRMLGDPAAPDILDQLRRLAGLGVQVHAQIVVVPEWNDGDALRRSIADLAALWPTLRTLAIVPVGLTRFHRGGLRVLRPDEAKAVLDIVAAGRGEEAATSTLPVGETRAPASSPLPTRARCGCTWVYPSDELFLQAGEPIPPTAFYDDDAQRENGVGLVRELMDDWEATRSELARRARPKRRPGAQQRATLVCGGAIAPTLSSMAAELGDITGAALEVLPVVNRLFGEQVTVSGLLTGEDVLEALRGRDLGECVFLPEVMFAPGDDETQRVTLDDLTFESMAAQLLVPVSLASTMSEVADVLFGGRRSRRRGGRQH